MTDPEAFILETLQCGTNAAGDSVALILGGKEYAHRYSLPTRRLGTVIEQLLKIYNTSRANGALAELAKQPDAPPLRPVLETFLVDDMTVVFSDSGPVTIRIVSRDGSRDIVFQPKQWQLLRSPLSDPRDSKNIGASH